jgi:hypothetical protein
VSIAHGFLFALLAGVLQIEIVHVHYFCHLASTGRIISPTHVTKSAGDMIGLLCDPAVRSLGEKAIRLSPAPSEQSG